MPNKSKFYTKTSATNENNPGQTQVNSSNNAQQNSAGAASRNENDQNRRGEENPLATIFVPQHAGQINPKVDYYSLLWPFVMMALTSSPLGLIYGNIFLNPRLWRNSATFAGDIPMFLPPTEMPRGLGRREYLMAAMMLPFLSMHGNTPLLMTMGQTGENNLPQPREITPPRAGQQQA